MLYCTFVTFNALSLCVTRCIINLQPSLLKQVEMQLQESASGIDDLQLFEGDTFNMLVVYTDKAYCLMGSYRRLACFSCM